MTSRLLSGGRLADLYMLQVESGCALLLEFDEPGTPN
jgi:hypothetical protein